MLAQAAGGGGWTMLIWLVAIIPIMWFLMIRPQQKQAKEHREMLAGLKKGDDVIALNGLLGKIYSISEKIVTLEVANGVRVRVSKAAVQGKVTVPDEKADEKTEKGEEKREAK